MEMPVRDFKRIGDFGKEAHLEPTSSFKAKTDIKLLRHEKMERMLRKGLDWAPQTIDIFIVNNRIEIKQEIFFQRHQNLSSNYRKTVEEFFNIKLQPGHITIIILSNGGVVRYKKEAGPMTPWMAVHRFWQSVYDYGNECSLRNEIQKLSGSTSQLLPKNYSYDYYDTLKILPFTPAFTFRSARENNISQADDIFFEALTQFCFKGEVIMNDADIVFNALSDYVDNTDPKQWKLNYTQWASFIKNYIPILAYKTMDELDGGVLFIT